MDNMNSSDRPLPAHQSTDDEEFMIGGTYAHFLRMSSFFGLAPLRFKTHGNGYIVSISIPMCIYSYILITAIGNCLYTHISVAAVAIFYLTTERIGLQSWPSLVSRVLSHLTIAVVSIGIYTAPFRMRRLFKSMSTIALVDQSIDIQYSTVTERRVMRYPALTIILFISGVAFDIIYAVDKYKTNYATIQTLVNMIMLCITNILIFMLNMQFAFTVMSVYARFKAANRVLRFTAKHLSMPYGQREESPYLINTFARRLAPVDVQSKIVIVRKSVSGKHHLVTSLCGAVQRISFLHGLLSDVVNDVNNNYSVILVFTVIICMLNLTVFSFFFVLEIYKNELDTFFMILIFFAFCVHLLTLLMMVEPCHYTIEECNKTSSIVSGMMMECPTQVALGCRLKVFSRQLMLQHRGYKPMGLFTMDRSLITSIFGIVTTYLVILLQFQDSSSR